MGLIGLVRRHRISTSLLATVIVAVSAFGLFWFAPWKLWTTTTVNDEIPIVAAADADSTNIAFPLATPPSATTAVPEAPDEQSEKTPESGLGTTASSGSRTRSNSAAAGRTAHATTTASPTTTAAKVLRHGTLISHEHETTGTARVIRLADSSRILTLEGLATSDGPDVHVWLAAAPVVAGESGWYLFDDDAHVDLGRLKGNRGNQVYQIPDNVDLSKFGSVTLWCERFSVSFGAAALR